MVAKVNLEASTTREMLDALLGEFNNLSLMKDWNPMGEGLNSCSSTITMEQRKIHGCHNPLPPTALMVGSLAQVLPHKIMVGEIGQAPPTQNDGWCRGNDEGGSGTTMGQLMVGTWHDG